MTAEQAEGIRDLFAQTIEQDVPKTAKVLAAVPHGNRDYKPDPKSRSAWDLATHLATADVWFLDGIIKGGFVRPEGAALPEQMIDPEGVAGWYLTHLPARLASLRQMGPDQLLKPVQGFGMTQPAVAWLVMMNNHSVHHRGQLAAYLRPSGGKVPALFGASADENPFAKD